MAPKHSEPASSPAGEKRRGTAAKASASKAAAATAAAAAATTLDEATPTRRKQLNRRDTDKNVQRTLEGHHFKHLSEEAKNHKLVEGKTLRQVLTDAYHELPKDGRLSATFLANQARLYGDVDVSLEASQPANRDVPMNTVLVDTSEYVQQDKGLTKVDTLEHVQQDKGFTKVDTFEYVQQDNGLTKSVEVAQHFSHREPPVAGSDADTGNKGAASMKVGQLATSGRKPDVGLRYDADSLPPDMLNKIQQFYDTDKSGTISIQELMLAAECRQQVMAERSMFRRATIALFVLLVLLLAALFGVSVAAIELTKEMRAGIDGVMRTPSGDTVRIASSEITVDENGMLVGWGETAGRRLKDGSVVDGNSSNLLKTAKSKVPLQLSSSLGDSVFRQLEELSLSNDVGAAVHLRILGFYRVPSVGARCGSVVYLVTASGTIMMDDTDISFEDGAFEELGDLGFSLAVGGLGRRLSGASAATGFFNAVEAQQDDWKCSGVPLPVRPRNFSADVVVYTPCKSSGSEVVGRTRVPKCESTYGGLLPGVVELPGELRKAVMSTTQQAMMGVEVLANGIPKVTDDEEPLYMVTEDRRIETSAWTLSMLSYPLHWAQRKFHISDLTNGIDFQFQLGSSGSREYCFNHTELSRLRRRLSEVNGSTMETAKLDEYMHIEYKGLWVEAGKTYRHWRMLPLESAKAMFSGATEDAGLSIDKLEYEYWDVPETLEPYRLVIPNGTILIYSNFGAGSVADVEAQLADWGMQLSEATADGCFTDAAAASSWPLMSTPFRDLTQKGAAHYEDVWHQDSRFNSTQTYAAILRDDFQAYLSQLKNPLAVADRCAVICGITSSQASGGRDQQCSLALSHSACLLNDADVRDCRESNMAQTALLCSKQANGSNISNISNVSNYTSVTSRRLDKRAERVASADRGFDEEGEVLEEEEEHGDDETEVDAIDASTFEKTISSGAIIGSYEKPDLSAVEPPSTQVHDVGGGSRRLFKFDHLMRCGTERKIEGYEVLGNKITVDLCYPAFDPLGFQVWNIQAKAEGKIKLGTLEITAEGDFAHGAEGSVGEIIIFASGEYYVVGVEFFVGMKGGLVCQTERCWGLTSCWFDSCEARRRAGSWTWRRRSQRCQKSCEDWYDCNHQCKFGMEIYGGGSINILGLVQGKVQLTYDIFKESLTGSFDLEYRFSPVWPDFWRHGGSWDLF